jgi:hypothetical protein
MMTMSRRRLLASFALPLVAACEAERRVPTGTALPPPRAEAPPTAPPLPSDATDDYLAERRASRNARPTGPDMMTAPIPGDRPRAP